MIDLTKEEIQIILDIIEPNIDILTKIYKHEWETKLKKELDLLTSVKNKLEVVVGTRK